MSGISVKAPLQKSSEDGFGLTKDLKENIKQNLKMLILTSPGERVMTPNFGVGIKKYLFEMSNDQVFAAIDTNIREQVSTYLPYIRIDRIQFDTLDTDLNKIIIKVTYSVPRIALSDVLITDVL
jgi:hypothetical protein